MKRRICIVGGEDVEKRIDLSKYLHNAGYEVTILGTSPRTFPDFINYIPYNLDRKFSVSSDWKTVVFLRKFFKDNSFDIIQTFDTKPAFLVPIALKKTKVPIVRTITGLGTVFMSNSLFYKILRVVYKSIHRSIRKRVNHTIFQNKTDLDLFRSFKLVNSTDSSIVLSSGIELADDRPISLRSNSTFTFTCIARIVYEKGIVNLLEAAKLCSEEGYNFKVVLIGPLEENSSKINAKILENYSNYVDWIGAKKEVDKYLLTSDAFILPTFREGFSRVLLEAAAFGLPMITTNVPGVGDIVRHNKEGLIAEVRNSRSLANAMITLASDPNLCNTFAKNALKRVELFSLKNVSEQYISIFERIITNKC